MATGIQVNGVDIDTLFKPRTSAKIADVHWQSNGVDISNLFEGRAGSPAIANTNLQSNGVDLAQLFMDINYNPVSQVVTSFTSKQIVLQVGGETADLSVQLYNGYTIRAIYWSEPADAANYLIVELNGTPPNDLVSSMNLVAGAVNHTELFTSFVQEVGFGRYVCATAGDTGNISVGPGVACTVTIDP